MKPTTWPEVAAQLHQIEYGKSVVAAYGGMPTDTEILYIANSFLDGLVNYLEGKRVFLTNRYGISDDDIEEMDERTRPFFADAKGQAARHSVAVDCMQRESNMNVSRFDDAWVYGYTENSYWFMWYDQDCSDCSVIRLNRATFPELTFNEFVDLHLAFKTSPGSFKYWRHNYEEGSLDAALVVEVKNSNIGWIHG